jgi:hypothetical protein
MTPSITSIAAAILLAGAATLLTAISAAPAQAQNIESGVAPLRAPSAQHSGAHHRTHAKGRARRAPDATEGEESTPDMSMPRIPSVFRNCEEPAPRFCWRL